MISFTFSPIKIIMELKENELKLIKLKKVNKKIRVLKVIHIELIRGLNLSEQLISIKNKMNLEGFEEGYVYLILNDYEVDTEIINIPRTHYKNQMQILNHKYNLDGEKNYTQYIHLDINKENNFYDKFLVYKINKQKVENYKKYIRNLGFNPKVLDVKSNAYMKSINYTKTKNGEYDIRRENILIIEFLKENTNLILLDNGIITYIKNLQIGTEYILNNKNKEKTNTVDEFNNIDNKLTDLINLIKSSIQNQIIKPTLILVDGDLISKLNLEELLENSFERKVIMINKLDEMIKKEEKSNMDNYVGVLGGIIRRKRCLNGRYKFF